MAKAWAKDPAAPDLPHLDTREENCGLTPSVDFRYSSNLVWGEEESSAEGAETLTYLMTFVSSVKEPSASSASA